MATAVECSELLLRWQDLRQQGKEVSPEVICADCPELVEELRRQIQALEYMEGLLGLQQQPGHSTPVVDGANGAHPTPIGASDSAAPANIASIGIPGYEILGVLDQGGMGVIYKARQTKLKRLTALKMILNGPHAGPQQRARFRAEAEAIAQLQHPHIVQIYEVGEWESRPYYSMEYMEGGSLAGKLAGTLLPFREAAQLIRTLAETMHFAHQHGIVHRDLKPANILLSTEYRARSTESESPYGASGNEARCPEYASQKPFGPNSDNNPLLLDTRYPVLGTPKITDFGLAKRLDGEMNQTQSGAVMGTPSYMAPEQAEGKTRAIGPPVDIYALGTILYEMLTGRPPFRAETTLDTLEQVRLQEPIPPRRLQPKVPGDLETICLHCLEKDPGKRYPTAARLADDLRRFLAGEAIQARPTTVWNHSIKWAKRKPALATLIVVSVVAVISLLGLGIGFTVQLQAERDRAYQQQLWAEEQERIAWEQRRQAEQERIEADLQRARAQAILRQACAAVDQNAWATVNSKAEARVEQAPGGILYNLACVYSLASVSIREETALTVDDRKQLAEQYAARAVQLLINAQSVGYFNDPAKLAKFKKDRDLDSLRSRPDFQKLQASLEKPVAGIAEGR